MSFLTNKKCLIENKDVLKKISPVEGKTSRGTLRYLKELRELARKNRSSATESERKMWDILRRKNFNFKFIRQKPVDRFVVDFYCSELLLAIEIDGGYHQKTLNYDKERDRKLGWRAIKVIRYNSKEVLINIEKAKEDIMEKIKERAIELKVSPCPVKGKDLG